jgi:hypothetical protein
VDCTIISNITIFFNFYYFFLPRCHFLRDYTKGVVETEFCLWQRVVKYLGWFLLISFVFLSPFIYTENFVLSLHLWILSIPLCISHSGICISQFSSKCSLAYWGFSVPSTSNQWYIQRA